MDLVTIDLAKRLRVAAVLTVLVISVGTGGYALILHTGFLDSLYMTVITVATVGFREVAPLTDAAKAFTIVLIFFGVATLGYAAGTLVEFMLEGHLTGIMEKRRMTKGLSKMQGHFVVAGFGRVGQEVARSFAGHAQDFVVVDSDREAIAECTEEGYLCLAGDATDDEVLKDAGLERATGLIAALDSDADNIFVTLTARQLCPDLLIVARAEREENELKLRKAGADRVLTPAVIGGRRMASLALKPLVSEYLDVVMRAKGIEYRLEEFQIGEGSCLAGNSMRAAGIRNRTGALVIAINRGHAAFNTNPSPDLALEVGDRLIVMGTEKQIASLVDLDRACLLAPPPERE